MTEWILKNKKADIDKLQQELGLSKTVCRVLANRGITEPEQARIFLHPQEQELYDASLLKNAEKACEYLLRALNEKKKIRIIGDYDVDGVMATFLLYKALSALGAVVDYRIPDRIADGYGMNMQMIEEAEQDKIALLLTCDNGIAAMEPITRAKELGMEVIVTDHHELPCRKEGDTVIFELPPADVIVNPKQPDETYPQQGICGAMVAYKVMCVLYNKVPNEEQRCKGKELLSELLVPVALATVCDVMELTGENRIAVAKGLALAKTCGNFGIGALLEAYELMEKELTAYHAGFLIGPCFNAAGRLDTALLGLELLLCSDAQEAKKRAMQLKELNDIRKQMTVSATKEAVMLAQDKIARGNVQVLILYLPECHESLAGIVAGRVREKFYLPTIVLTKGEACIKGSGRSIESYSMYEKLAEHKELFLAFGGHPMAAGMSLEEQNIEELERVLNANAGLTEEDVTPKLYLDAVLPFAEISERFMEELISMEPYGNGNTKPVFASSGVTINGIKRIGQEGSSMRLQIADAAGTMLTGLYFNDAEELERYLAEEFGEQELQKLYQGRTKVSMTIAFSPSINVYRGTVSPQIVLEKYKKYISLNR